MGLRRGSRFLDMYSLGQLRQAMGGLLRNGWVEGLLCSIKEVFNMGCADDFFHTQVIRGAGHLEQTLMFHHVCVDLTQSRPRT